MQGRGSRRNLGSALRSREGGTEETEGGLPSLTLSPR